LDREGAVLMHSPYEMEWMAEERMKELEKAILRSRQRNLRISGGFVFRRVLSIFWRRK
jgi:hypothetical protein